MFFEEDGLDHQGYCIRPPSEASSILLQATLGCSHNKCTFCDAYKAKRFAIKDRSILERDLAYAAANLGHCRRLFVMDGDALVMPMRHWEWLLPAVAARLPRVERIATYANAKGVALKSDADLARLRELGLGMIYYGVESGHPEVLRRVRKGAGPEKLLAQARRLKEAGFILSVTVIVGLGGRELSLEHARATGELLSAMDPDFVGALTLMTPQDAPLGRDLASGAFQLPEPMDLLAELGAMFEHTHLSKGLFTANHASNYLPIRASLPQDRDKTLALIREALAGKVALKQEWQRAF